MTRTAKCADGDKGSNGGVPPEMRQNGWTLAATPIDNSFNNYVENPGETGAAASSAVALSASAVFSPTVVIAAGQSAVPEKQDSGRSLRDGFSSDRSLTLGDLSAGWAHLEQPVHVVGDGGGGNACSSSDIGNGSFGPGDGLRDGHVNGVTRLNIPNCIDDDASLYGSLSVVGDVGADSFSARQLSDGSDIRGDFDEGSAWVYRASSVSPQVMLAFGGPRPTKRANDTLQKFVDAEMEAKLRSGRVELRWTLCNPFFDKRLRRTLPLLFCHVAAVTTAVFMVVMGASFWTSAAANLEDGASPLGARDHSHPCGRSRSRGELRALLLSVDVPMFASLAVGFTLVMANIMGRIRLRRAMVVGLLEAAAMLCGTIVIIFGDPHQLWGDEGSLGFAGVWVAVQNLIGTSMICAGATWGSPQVRVISGRLAAVGFWIVLFGSATVLESQFYFVEFLKSTGLHPLYGLFSLVCTTLGVAVIIKTTFKRFAGLPTWACAMMLYWFEAGAYLSLRIYLHSQPDQQVMTMTISATAASEVLLRVVVVVSGKVIYNYCVRAGRHAMALRMLDLHIASLIMDIFAEWAAIGVAAGLDLFVDADLFQGLAMTESSGESVRKLGIAAMMELLADFASCLVTFAVLPISLEGLFRARGRLVSEIFFVFVTSIFLFSTLNMRVRIRCFE